jgi:ATP phosphoribosyltransferase regulatory subunit
MIATRTGGADAPLRIAVPKGAIFDDSVAALARAGLDVSGLAEPGRQLIVAVAGVEYIIGKPTDIPVYVAYGAADCAIGGKDVLVEAALDVVELVDLGFGGCRFVVAAPEDATSELAERARHLGVIRVATKYPRITEQHFSARGIQVEIVKLNGNIELAPLIGIADAIVDITATGTTLRQNRLRIVEDVLPSTARFVGNPVSVRIDPRVMELADALAATSLESATAVPSQITQSIGAAAPSTSVGASSPATESE